MLELCIVEFFKVLIYFIVNMLKERKQNNFDYEPVLYQATSNHNLNGHNSEMRQAFSSIVDFDVKM